jgi:predicted NAD/FAD-binding protein
LTFFRDLWDLDAWQIRLDLIRFAYIGLDYLRNPEPVDSSDSLFGDSEEEPAQPAHDVPRADDEYLGCLIEKHHLSGRFVIGYLVPLMAVLWNIPDLFTVYHLPARPVFQFLLDNHLLEPGRPWPRWSALQPGTDFNEVMKNVVPQRSIRYNASVRRIARLDGGGPTWGLEIFARSDIPILRYDHVVFAVPARTVLAILGAEATSQEMQILSGLVGAVSDGFLHKDRKVSAYPTVGGSPNRLQNMWILC